MRLPIVCGSCLSLLLSTLQVYADVTIYGQVPLAETQSATTTSVPQSTPGAYDDSVVLTPPPVPTGLNLAPKIDLQRDAVALQGLSIPHTLGSFFGFSIELSVISQLRECYPNLRQTRALNESVVGKNS